MTAFVAINFPEAIQSRLEEGRLPRFGPMLMLLARPALAFLAQGVTLLLLSQLKVPSVSISVRNWWSVYGTLIDFGCLGLLFWLTRREGVRLRDLLSFSKSHLKKDILLGLGIFVVVFPVCVLGGGMLGGGMGFILYALLKGRSQCPRPLSRWLSGSRPLRVDIECHPLKP